MERSGVFPQVAADPSDLADIGSAARPSEQRWRPVRDGAAGQGMPVEVLDAVDPAPDARREGHGPAVAAPAAGVLHLEHGFTALADRRIGAGPGPEGDIGAILRWAA